MKRYLIYGGIVAGVYLVLCAVITARVNAFYKSDASFATVFLKIVMQPGTVWKVLASGFQYMPQ